MKPGLVPYLSVLLVLVMSSTVYAGQDLLVQSLRVTGVKLLHDVDGSYSNNWTVKVFIRNRGGESLRGIVVGLTAWRGVAAKKPAKSRYLRRKGHSTFRKRTVAELKPGASVPVVFNVLTPAVRQLVRFGALVDSDVPDEKITAAAAAAGAWRGKIPESDEKNNYREITATH